MSHDLRDHENGVGPPIVRNLRFAVEVGAVLANATVFVGLSALLVATHVPPCTVYPQLPFLDVLTSTATAGVAEIRLPIPPSTSLSGMS